MNPPGTRKCVFLDRDGVINAERGTYTYKTEDFEILGGVKEALQLLRDHDFAVIVITNQSGISQGIYTRNDMEACHEKMLTAANGNIDDIFYCPWHPKVSESLARKPDRLMFERAIALHQIDVTHSWMVGDKERDIEPAKKTGLRSILIAESVEKTAADFVAESLLEAVRKVILVS